METGTWLVVVAVAVALAVAFVLRRRAPALLVAVALTLAGAAIGWGGMLLQTDPSNGEFFVAVVSLAFLVPAHVRIVLGPFGPQR